MEAERRIAIVLLGGAAVAWVVVALVGLNLDPRADPNAGVIGALALGVATGITAAPLFWLVSFARHHRIAYRGDWLRAGRRGAWVGVLVAVFVIMRINGDFQPQVGLFFVVLAIVAEVTLTAGGAARA